MLKKFLARFFGPEGAALTSKRHAFFYDVYCEQDGSWSFSWHSEDHSQGAVHEGFATRADAASVWLRWKQSLTPGQIAVHG